MLCRFIDENTVYIYIQITYCVRSRKKNKYIPSLSLERYWSSEHANQFL